jgi:hypothetical protein
VHRRALLPAMASTEKLFLWRSEATRRDRTGDLVITNWHYCRLLHPLASMLNNLAARSHAVDASRRS